MTPICENIIFASLNTKEWIIARKAQTVAAPEKSGKSKELKAPRFSVPFTRKNYLILGAGVVMLLVGYVLMGQPPHDGFLSLTLSPILLTAAYCIVIPWGIMARDKSDGALARGD
ncbi:MAG: hypothetical protein H6508_09640 [Calditrichaeota bacterium]|nr:hypothetical protein [Calditrichota bacterium]